MKTILRILLWAAVIAWMGLIFSFSVETAAESTETSGGFIAFFMEKWLPGFTALSPRRTDRKNRIRHVFRPQIRPFLRFRRSGISHPRRSPQL